MTNVANVANVNTIIVKAGDVLTLREEFRNSFFHGPTLTVKGITANGHFVMWESFCSWAPEMFEETNGFDVEWENVFKHEEPSSAFTRENLEDGMVVETESGLRFLVSGTDLIGQNNVDSLANYTYELEHHIASFLSIVKVYTTGNKTLAKVFEDENLMVLWDRTRGYVGKKWPVITLGEACEFFGEIRENFMEEDIRNGMILEAKSGVRFLVVAQSLYGLNSVVHLFQYLTNLQHKIFDDLTIVKAYEAKTVAPLSRVFDDESLTLIWERK